MATINNTESKVEKRRLLIHKLASPLTTLIGYTSMLKKELTNKSKISDDKVSELFNYIENDLKKLRDIVEKLNQNP